MMIRGKYLVRGQRRHIMFGVCLLAALALAACSDDGDSGQDGGALDGGATDGGRGDAKLWSCETPGKACNAHDPCAINPTCGKDRLCHPQTTQNCDDKLACTTDTCAGLGLCKHTVKDGFCALMVPGSGGSVQQCIKDGAKNPKDPCLACDSKLGKKSWSAASGAKCDDGNTCTKDDMCKSGQCAGTYYGNKCGDGLSCTDDLCDGKGGCANKMKSDWCRIGKSCHKDGTTDKGGCSVCDVKKNQYAWTLKKDVCKIGANCYNKAATDTSGCGVCDPTKSATSWTPSTGSCLIQGLCYKKGEQDASGCGTCQPATSATAFTPASGKCLIAGKCHKDGDASPSGCGVCSSAKNHRWWTPPAAAKLTLSTFESGLGTWTLTSPVGGVGWQVSKTRSHGGKNSLYYGNPTTGSYDNGKANSGTATAASVTLPAGQKSALTLWLFMDTESTSTLDVLTISAGAKVLWSKNAASTMPLSSYRRWVPVELDLSALAGQTVKLSFTFDTKDDWANATEGVYLDDVALVTGCGKK